MVVSIMVVSMGSTTGGATTAGSGSGVGSVEADSPHPMAKAETNIITANGLIREIFLKTCFMIFFLIGIKVAVYFLPIAVSKIFFPYNR
jgi:hypothetical protein